MHKSGIFYLLPILFLLASCNNKVSRLESALSLSGHNRPELDKVLNHYSTNSGDSLKYKAACFLIENMVWHYGKLAGSYNSLWYLFLQNDSLIRQPVVSPVAQGAGERVLDGTEKIPAWGFNNSLMPDLLHLDATFLIDNIDAAFVAWESEWGRNLTFDEFCELLLPYRFGHEPVFAMRNKLNEHFSPIILQENTELTLSERIDSLHKYIGRIGTIWETNGRQPDLGFFNIFWPYSASLNCEHHVALVGQLARAAGIPISTILIPAWRDSQSGHAMNAIPGENGKFDMFTALYQKPADKSMANNLDHATKVYRSTFAAQANTPYFLRKKQEELPPGFGSPCIIDITSEYTNSSSIDVKLTEKTNDVNLVWFSVFINGSWQPIGWGNVNHQAGLANFRNVPVDLTGAACVFRNGKLSPVSDMITVGKNEITSAKPSGEFENMVLTRKFPEKKALLELVTCNYGAIVEGANDPDFHDAVKIGQVTVTLKPHLQDVIIDQPAAFRYYRIKAVTWGLELAEVEFITSKPQNGTEHASALPLLHPDSMLCGPWYRFTGMAHSEKSCLKAFDGDMLTSSSQKWIGMDMMKPVWVERVRIAPRNAHNGIVPGHRYQLLYWNDAWIPLGMQTATGNYVKFENVPSNTIYWLRNLDHGREEQPFFYTNNRQVFINAN
jgi:hypothetical protein